MYKTAEFTDLTVDDYMDLIGKIAYVQISEREPANEDDTNVVKSSGTVINIQYATAEPVAMITMEDPGGSGTMRWDPDTYRVDITWKTQQNSGAN